MIGLQPRPSCARMSVVASCMSTAKYNDPSLGSAPRSSKLFGEVETVVDDGDHRRGAPSPLVSFGSAPPLISASATSSYPLRAANISAVKPPVGWSPFLRSVSVRDVRLAIGIRAGFQQRLDDVQVAFGRRPHQRRLLLIRIRRVDDGLESSSGPRRRGLCATRHQRRLAVGMPAGRLGSASSSALMIATSPLRLACSSGVMP